MNPPEPKSARGKIVRFVLYNLPGLLFILLLVGLALFVNKRIAEKKAGLEAELGLTSTENVFNLQLEPTGLWDRIKHPDKAPSWENLKLVTNNDGGIEKLVVKEGEEMITGQLVARIKGKEYRIAGIVEEEFNAPLSSETQPVNVVTLTLQPTVLRDKINLPGVIEPWTRMDLMAKIGGSIEEVLVKEGEQVRQGQLIARIESKDYQIALDSAKAAYELAKISFSRNQTLRSKGIATQANLDELEAQLRQAKAAVENAELQLSRCKILAPLAGVISRLDAKVGSVVNQMVPASIAEILALDQVKAVVSIPESDVAAVRRLQNVEVEIQALGNEKVRAAVYFLAPATETQAHVYRLELRIPNQDHHILPGMFVRANIVKEVRDHALAVPLFSVISRNKEQFVYVEENGAARKKPVQIGFLEGWQVLITDGLQAGDKVIVEGHRSVEDGQKVKVVKSLKEGDSELSSL
jgi:membrane fusion protein (multidrug efflux system)